MARELRAFIEATRQAVLLTWRKAQTRQVCCPDSVLLPSHLLTLHSWWQQRAFAQWLQRRRATARALALLPDPLWAQHLLVGIRTGNADMLRDGMSRKGCDLKTEVCVCECACVCYRAPSAVVEAEIDATLQVVPTHPPRKAQSTGGLALKEQWWKFGPTR